MISLISHTSKIEVKILTRCLNRVAEDYIREDQFGFGTGRGTREAMGTMRMLSEK